MSMNSLQSFLLGSNKLDWTQLLLLLLLSLYLHLDQISQFTNLLIATPFRFEPGNYKPGFAKPSMLLEKRIVGIPYYDIVEEQITEDVTINENPGEIIPTTKITQLQKMRYIIDSNIYAKEDLILVCRVESRLCTATFRRIYEDCRL
jgi:hypothetical protein